MLSYPKYRVYNQDPLMLLLALLKWFRYLKVALKLLQQRLQGGNT
jgi:DNA-binding transcriptional MerR regulator